MIPKIPFLSLLLLVLFSCGPNGIHRTIQGNVVSYKTGKPIPNARLTLLGSNHGNTGEIVLNTSTDSLGHFNIYYNRGLDNQFTLYVDADSLGEARCEISKRDEVILFSL